MMTMCNFDKTLKLNHTVYFYQSETSCLSKELATVNSMANGLLKLNRKWLNKEKEEVVTGPT